MLVKQSIVENWYQTDSWVYKNFAYLFQNPLWSNRIPSGFSVCPYFWLSLFSLLIFRLFFVVPLKYFFIPIVKALGKPGRVVDEFLYNFIHKTTGGGPDYYHPGCGIAGAVLFLLLFVFSGMVIVFSGIKTYEFYNYLATVGTEGLFCFWSIASFVVLYITIGIHAIISNSQCKTRYYIYPWLVLFLIAALVFVPHEFLNIFSVLFSWIGDFFRIIGIGLYHALGIIFG